MTGRWHKVGYLGVKPKQLSPSQHPRITYSSSSAAAYYSPALHPGLTRPHLVPCDCPMVGSLCPGLWALKPAQAPKPTAQQPQPCSSSKGSLYFLGESKGAHWGRGAGLRGHTLETLTREASPQFQTLNGWLALSDPAWSPRRTSQHLLLGSFRGCRHPPPKTKARPWQL